MLERIGTRRTSQTREARARRRGAGEGFGHRVYKSYDPRAKIIKRDGGRGARPDGTASTLGNRPRTRAESRSKTTTSSSANFTPTSTSTGIIYQAPRLSRRYFPVLFAIPRTAGWLAQWREMIVDPEQKIARPAPDLRRPLAPPLRADRSALAAQTRASRSILAPRRLPRAT